jgi:hypothetical protein
LSRITASGTSPSSKVELLHGSGAFSVLDATYLSVVQHRRDRVVRLTYSFALASMTLVVGKLMRADLRALASRQPATP